MTIRMHRNHIARAARQTPNTNAKPADSLLILALAGAAAFACSASAQPAQPSQPLADTGATAPAAPNSPPSTTPTTIERGPDGSTRAESNALGDGQSWTIEINPRLWWMSPSGSLRMPGSSSEVRLERLNLDNPEFTPAGQFTIRAERWSFTFFGAGYSRDTQTTADSTFTVGSVSAVPGDSIEAAFDLNVFELMVGYRFWEYDFAAKSADPAAAAPVTLALDAVLGGRLYELDLEVSSASARTATDQLYIEPIAGIRGQLDIVRDFTISLQLDGGGMGDSDRSSYSFNISTAFEWRPIPNVGLQIGWRQILYTFQDGEGAQEFEYDGGIAGVFGGIVIRF